MPRGEGLLVRAPAGIPRLRLSAGLLLHRVDPACRSGRRARHEHATTGDRCRAVLGRLILMPEGAAEERREALLEQERRARLSSAPPLVRHRCAPASARCRWSAGWLPSRQLTPRPTGRSRPTRRPDARTPPDTLVFSCRPPADGSIGIQKPDSVKPGHTNPSEGECGQSGTQTVYNVCRVII